jgi:DegV family protein with EDD domain
MTSVAVVTDSTADIRGELAARLDVSVVSLSVVYADGKSVPESELTDLAAYWRKLADLSHLPTTSQPSVGAFTECYEPLLAAGKDIVSVHISGDLSGTLDSARLAAETLAEKYPDRTIRLCDSRSAGGGLAMVALAAYAAAARGENVESVGAAADQAAEQAQIWFAVESLEHLRRGGRIGSAQAWLGTALKIKPILTCEGEITPIERVRTSKRAFERMVAFAEQLRDEGKTSWVVQHIQAPSEAALLVDRATEILGTEPLLVSEVGPVIGTHVGPGLLGIGGLPPITLPD